MADRKADEPSNETQGKRLLQPEIRTNNEPHVSLSWEKAKRQRNPTLENQTVVFQKVCLGRRLQILQICKYSDSCFQIHTPRRVDLIFVL